MAPVRVGILHSVSGTMAVSEAPLIDAALMAIAEINQSGGVRSQLIEPIVEDGSSNPRCFELLARKLIQQKQVTTVFGCWTSASRKAVLPVFENLNALLWYPAQYEGLECSKNIFYTGSCSNQQVEPAVSWLLQNKGKKFYLLGSDYVFPRTANKLIQAQLKQQGGRVVGEEYVPLGTTEFTEIVKRIQQAEPDVVFSTLNGDSNIAFYRQYQDSGITASEIPILAVSVAEAELKRIGEAAAGHYACWSYFQSLDTPNNRRFVQNFQARYGANRVTSDPIEAAYTQVYLWKQAVELAQSFEVERVRVAAYGQSFDAPGGLVRIEPNHHVGKACRIGKILPTGQFEIVGGSNDLIKPLPWLGVEEVNFRGSDVVIDMLAEVSQKLWQLDQKSRDLEAATAQLHSEILERQRVEAALRESEAELRALFAAMTDVILIVDAQGRYRKIAPTKPALLYKPAQQLIGKTLHEIFGQSVGRVATPTSGFLDATASHVVAGAVGGSIANPDELTAPNLDTTDTWENGFASHSLTHKSTLHTELTAPNVTTADTWENNLVSRLPMLTPAQDSNQGATPDRRTLTQADTFLSYIREALNTKETVNFEYSLTLRTQEVWFAASVSPISEDAVMWVARDITEQKWAQEALQKAKAELELKVEERTAALKSSNDYLIAEVAERQQAENALRVAKDQLQAILDAVPGIVSWISSDLRYLGVNRHLSQTFNLPPEAFVGQDIGFLRASTEFNDFVRQFFASPAQEAYREVSTLVNNSTRNYLIVAQKYDRDQAAFTVGIDITSRRQTEEALRQAEAKYRTIFEHAVEGIFQTTPDGHYLSANPALARIYGYKSPEELIANLTNVQEQLYVDPNRRAKFVQFMQAYGSIAGFESQIYRKDGSVTWISENACAVRDDNGVLLYYEGTVEDISERKRAEEALLIANEQLEIRVEERTAELLQSNQRLVIEIAERQRVEAELRALFAAMTDVIAVFDAQGRYLKMVTTNSALLYKPTTERIGKTVFEILPARQANLFFSNIQRALNTGQTVSLEYSLPISEREQDWSEAEDTIPEEHERILNPKWNEVWFSANVSPMPGNCVIWVARNITGRKLAEAALRQAEEKYRSIFENAAEGIFQTTFDGRYLSVNPALARMYGYSDAEEMMTHLTDVEQQLYVHPNRRTQFIAALEEHGAVSNFEAQVYRKDGTIIWTSQNARTVRDTQGRLLYYEGTVADITQRKFAEEALRVEQQKSERLLLNILPESIAERLKQDQHSIADRFEEVTILFADIVDFTKLAAQISATKLVNLLNEIFCTFDQITLAYGLEKIKTIGDSYMVVGGLPTLRSDHAEAIAEMALAMQQEIAYFQRDDGEPFHIRIGIHTGPVVAGVIGMKKFAYDLWGDTVNVASRMESQGMPGKIQVTKATYERLKDKYSFERRGAIAVKGKGEMITYWLTGRKVCHLRDGNSAQLY